jgi:hypothetical protein
MSQLNLGRSQAPRVHVAVGIRFNGITPTHCGATTRAAGVGGSDSGTGMYKPTQNAFGERVRRLGVEEVTPRATGDAKVIHCDGRPVRAHLAFIHPV